MLANRLRKRQRHLRRWARRQGIDCYRLYERDIPDHPLIVDWYAGEAVVWSYPRTRDEDQAADQAWVAEALTAVAEGLDIDPEAVHHKRRQRQRGAAQYERLGESGRPRLVREGDWTFEVDLEAYLDTGLFLDHRDTRRLVQAEAQGRRCLNLFAYTGSFSVAMASGGASRVDTVDLSRTYLDWAERNLQHNRCYDPQRTRLIHADCCAHLEGLPDKPYDLIVCDPPTFSNSKRMQGTWAVGRDHPWLWWRLWNWTAPGGLVYFSTNDRGFDLADGLPPFQRRELTPDSLPPDFRNRRIHRCWLLQRPG